MLGWLKNRSREDLPEPVSGAGKSAGEARGQAHGKFRMEPLEPRVLLSADPLAVVVAGQALLDATANTSSANS